MPGLVKSKTWISTYFYIQNYNIHHLLTPSSQLLFNVHTYRKWSCVKAHLLEVLLWAVDASDCSTQQWQEFIAMVITHQPLLIQQSMRNNAIAHTPVWSTWECSLLCIYKPWWWKIHTHPCSGWIWLWAAPCSWYRLSLWSLHARMTSLQWLLGGSQPPNELAAGSPHHRHICAYPPAPPVAACSRYIPTKSTTRWDHHRINSDQTKTRFLGDQKQIATDVGYLADIPCVMRGDVFLQRVIVAKLVCKLCSKELRRRCGAGYLHNDPIVRNPCFDCCVSQDRIPLGRIKDPSVHRPLQRRAYWLYCIRNWRTCMFLEEVEWYGLPQNHRRFQILGVWWGPPGRALHKLLWWASSELHLCGQVLRL